MVRGLIETVVLLQQVLVMRLLSVSTRLLLEEVVQTSCQSLSF